MLYLIAKDQPEHGRANALLIAALAGLYIIVQGLIDRGKNAKRNKRTTKRPD